MGILVEPEVAATALAVARERMARKCASIHRRDQLVFRAGDSLLTAELELDHRFALIAWSD